MGTLLAFCGLLLEALDSRALFLAVSVFERGWEVLTFFAVGGVAAFCCGALDFWNNLPTLFSARLPTLLNECEERCLGCSALCCRSVAARASGVTVG
ncbi:hypothetical protein [Pseudomonas syringae group genomosp. 3]|uniref:hypothetical protein n=1 Tax=Pseudomonas syringae group genomosp. 3 TaxID=251701 RepID=UPI0038B7D6E2